MPTWNDILAETNKAGSTHDVVRRRYLKKLAARTKRNTIIYYSGWLQKTDLARQMPHDPHHEMPWVAGEEMLGANGQ